MASLNWSGRSWTIWDQVDNSGKFYYSPNSVYVDSNGWLHIGLNEVSGKWYASCLFDNNPTGWGTYQWVIQGLHLIDKNCTFGLFVYDNNTSYQELDIEQGAWGYAPNEGQWDMLVQPSSQYGGTPGEFRLSMPNTHDILCTIEWTSGTQYFSMVDMTTGQTLQPETEHFPVSAVSPHVVRAYMQLYPFPGVNWSNPVFPTTGNQYYVIKSFNFTPPGQTPPTPTPPTPTPPSPTGSTKLTLVSPTSGSVGSSITVYCVLSNNGTPIKNASVTLSASGGITAPSFPLTDSNGYCAITAKLTGSGTVQLQAHYAGGAGGSAATSNTESISVSGSSTATGMTLDGPTSAKAGTKITIYGVLSTSAGHAVVSASVTISLSNGTTLYPPETDSNGYFATTYTMPSGTLSCVAHFAGESGLAACTSPTIAVNATHGFAPGDFMPYLPAGWEENRDSY